MEVKNVTVKKPSKVTVHSKKSSVKGRKPLINHSWSVMGERFMVRDQVMAEDGTIVRGALVSCQYQLIGVSEDGYHGSAVGNVQFNSPSGIDHIPLEQLTEKQVLTWVLQELTAQKKYAHVIKMVAKKIDDQRSGIAHERDLPWLEGTMPGVVL